MIVRHRASQGGFQVGFARSDAEILEAQRFRHEIFTAETGARFSNPGIDEDRFDPYCDHLLIRDAGGRLAGYTRLLTQEQAMHCGGFYTETEFDMRKVLKLPGRFLEVGRTCIHPDYRNGATIAVLWSGIAPILKDHGYQFLFGCVSIPLAGGVGPVRALIRQTLASHECEASLRVTPRLPLPNMARRDVSPSAPPPLLKAYLRLGAQICGEASWDREFRTADLMALLQRDRLTPRYERHFLKAS